MVQEKHFLYPSIHYKIVLIIRRIYEANLIGNWADLSFNFGPDFESNFEPDFELHFELKVQDLKLLNKI